MWLTATCENPHFRSFIFFLRALTAGMSSTFSATVSTTGPAIHVRARCLDPAKLTVMIMERLGIVRRSDTAAGHLWNYPPRGSRSVGVAHQRRFLKTRIGQSIHTSDRQRGGFVPFIIHARGNGTVVRNLEECPPPVDCHGGVIPSEPRCRA